MRRFFNSLKKIFNLRSSNSSLASRTEQPFSDDALIERLCRRDQSAFDDLYGHYENRVHSAIYRVVRNRFIAEDLVQEVFMKAWMRAKDFERGRSRCLSAWIVAIARNHAIDYLRSRENRMTRRSRELFIVDIRVHGLNVEERIARNRQIARLTSALEKLDPEHRRVLTLVYFEGLTHVQTAKRQSRPLGTVKTWVRQALASLRQQMIQTPQ